MTLAPLTVLVPLIGAPILAALSPFVSRRGGALTLAFAIAALVLAALLLSHEGERVIVWFGGWRPRGDVALGVDFAVDGIGAGLALFVTVLGVAAAVISARVIRAETLHFDAAALVFVAAMAGFALSGDLFNMFVFFELMSVAAYVLVGYEVRERAPIEGSLTFAITNTIGSVLFLFGIGLVYGRTGALNLAQIGQALTHGGPADALVVVAFALIASGLFVKAAIVPFHLWLADAYAVAPTPACMLLAGAFSEMGLYGLARIYWTAFHGVLVPHADELRAVLVALGVLTGVVGAAMCAAQHHLKRLLAFATIALEGMFLVALGLLSADGVAATAVWIVGDGLVKASLFACVALLQHRYRSIHEHRLHGRGRALWPLGAVFALGGLVIASLPPSGSFLGRSLAEDAALEAPGYDWVPVVLALVTGVVGGAVLRAAARTFLGLGAKPPDEDAGRDDDDEDSAERGEQSEGSAPLLWIPAVVLLAAAFAWGVFPGLLGGAAHAAAAFTDTSGYAAAVLHGATPVAPHVELESPSGTGYAYAALSLVTAVVVAAVPLLRGGPLPAPLTRAVAALRAIHNGHPGDYVAWAATGAGVLAVVFAFTLR